MPQSEWIIVENTHEPIIDKDMFDKVQLLKDRNKNKQSKSNNYLLKGFLFCEECEHALTIYKRTETTIIKNQANENVTLRKVNNLGYKCFKVDCGNRKTCCTAKTKQRPFSAYESE